ncbi:hypothetical protein FQN54_001476 [Arachnomyces sp. PD_36]|nr:hypothetical protein FQN54_001476 [Arachnomyces sp. PD_36]
MVFGNPGTMIGMHPRKGNVYVALYYRNSRAPPDSYHWAILVESKSSLSGSSEILQYHIKNTIQPGISGQPWVFEESKLQDSNTRFRLLTRVLVGRVKKLGDASACLRSVPLIQGDPGWTCRVWVRDALAKLDADTIFDPERRINDWDAIEKECRRYVAEKKAAGRWEMSKPGVASNLNDTPTYDMLQGRETTP